MARYLMIENDKAVPLCAIEMIGATDKSSLQHSLGKYGSGQKFSVAAALRHGIDVRIATEGRMVKFATKTVALDREEVERVTMQVDNAKPKDRDWTTRMGQYDWRDKPDEGVSVAWMIVREFISNAYDEGAYRISVVNKMEAALGKTRVFIRMTPEIEGVVNVLPTYFLPESNRQPIAASDTGRIYAKLEKQGRIYCKGVFVRTVPEQLLYDYDFDELPLSESRTVDAWDLRSQLAQLITSLPSAALSRILSQIVEDRQCYEAGLSAYQLSNVDSKKLKESFEDAMGEAAVVCPEILPIQVDEQLSLISREKVILPEGWRNKLIESGVDDVAKVINEDIREGIQFLGDGEIKELDAERRRKIQWAYDLTCEWFASGLTDLPQLRFFRYVGNVTAKFLGRSDRRTYVAVSADYEFGEIKLLQTMVEEFAHFVSHAPDLSRELINCLTKSIATNMVQVKE